MPKKADNASPPPSGMEAVNQGQAFTISIYQDPSYIEGIVQQSSRGLITDSSDTDNAQNTQSSKQDDGMHGDIGAKVSFPGIGGFNAGAGASSSDGTSNENLFGQQRTRNFKYTSAYYLHHVRQDLRSAGLLRKVVSAEDLKNLEVGDFVEFQAKFSPDEIISLMDVFNPDLVAALTRWVRKNKIINSITNAETSEQQQALVLEFQTRPDADAEAAKAIAEAVRVDFRSGATRQYYGAIGSGSSITAVVVCDTRSFLVEDADRILDGNFTVLGKVSTPPATDVPILARNKVLDRIQPKAVDFLAENMRKVAKERIDSNIAEIQTMEQYLDLNFPSRIAGISFNVIPIAIYI
jgi:hypothetical protein